MATEPNPPPWYYAPARAVAVALAVAALLSTLLVIKSIVDFTHTGPAVRQQIAQHYGWYSVYAMARLGFWAWAVMSLFAGMGVLAYHCLAELGGWRPRILWMAVAGAAAIGLATAMQFIDALLYVPGNIMASFLYRMSRLYPVWEQLTPTRIAFLYGIVYALAAALSLACAWRLAARRAWPALAGLAAACVLFSGIVAWAGWSPEPAPARQAKAGSPDRPNILVLGSDTLRTDRMGSNDYFRDLTPNIDRLAERGTQFVNNFVPLARTAPSLTSILTGTWPYRHGIRSNYVADLDVALTVPSLPRILDQAGYATIAVSDWCGSDLRKLSFGFEITDTPPDQWNLKYLLRQGPKDLRLFLSLFAHNRFGRAVLPEIYFLGGVPMDREIGHATRRWLRYAAEDQRPFFLFSFLSSTHPPFGTTYPYYDLYSPPSYQGESRFAMSNLVDIRSIIDSQNSRIENFDYHQVVALYDAGVRSFDDEVRSIVAYLEASGLADNTIVVIFSDHGTELFDGQTWGQGNSVSGDDPSARAPLIIIDPRRPGSGPVTRVVRSIDLMPTLLELAGLPIPREVQGTSLVPLLDDPRADLDLTAYSETGLWIAGTTGELDPDHIRYPEILRLLRIDDPETGTLSLKPEYEPLVLAAKDRMIRTDRWKLVYRPFVTGPRYELYAIDVDPQARLDVKGLHPEVFADLKRRLDDWLRHDPHIAPTPRTPTRENP